MSSGSASNRAPGVRIKDIAADSGIAESWLETWFAPLADYRRAFSARPNPSWAGVARER